MVRQRKHVGTCVTGSAKRSLEAVAQLCPLDLAQIANVRMPMTSLKPSLQDENHHILARISSVETSARRSEQSRYLRCLSGLRSDLWLSHHAETSRSGITPYA